MVGPLGRHPGRHLAEPVEVVPRVEVADRYAEADRPLSRYAHAYARGDGEALWRCLPEAVADLRRRDQQYLAAFLDMASAGTLLGIVDAPQLGAEARVLAGQLAQLAHARHQLHDGTFEGEDDSHADFGGGTLTRSRRPVERTEN